MRKLIFFMLISLDGYYQGPNGEIDWHHVDKEFNEFAIDQLKSVDTILFGRTTYEGMANYWPTPMAIDDDPVVAKIMNDTKKIVVSSSLERADWQNTRLIRENAIQEISKLKSEPGKDMIIFGSSDFAVTLLPQYLIDEFRIMINPVVLGKGKTLFHGIRNQMNLRLVNSKLFRSGNVLLYYEPIFEMGLLKY